tara:strand:+ start:564 stop:722 length:159 start_codon:yes stop_codon:yes gene_type:complete
MIWVKGHLAGLWIEQTTTEITKKVIVVGLLRKSSVGIHVLIILLNLMDANNP